MKKILLFLLVPLLSFNLHKTHISLTKIVYKKESKTLQITSRLFIDDIENALRKKFNDAIELDTKKDTAKTDELLQKYFTEYLHISLNGHHIKLQFLGKEYEQDIVYIYFEIENVAPFNEISIQNTLLFELFDDQQNITKIQIGNYQKTLYFNLKNSKEKILIE
ncbi:MAG TPA: hypothetical protein ENK67_03825 [Flavobacteriia bacterium]|jgi:hypothetical protein|nr:hypothetical protein [Flavobacteriia bacterium]